MEGEIQYTNVEKGYGFIKCEEYPKGVFFHIKDFSGDFDSLQKGDKVQFDPFDAPKGIAAKNVELI